MLSYRRGTPPAALLGAVVLSCIVFMLPGVPATAQDAPAETPPARKCMELGPVTGAARQSVVAGATEGARALGYVSSEDEPPAYAAWLAERAYVVRSETGVDAVRELVIGFEPTEDGEGWLLAVCGAVRDGEALAPNPDVVEVLAAGRNALTVPVRELQYDTYELSCLDGESAVAILAQLGYATKAPEGEAALGDLPAVFTMANKVAKSLVGGKEDVSTKTIEEDTLSAPGHRLMMAYHPSQHQEALDLVDVIEGMVDVPDRQVLIEGMLIELNESDAREIGVEWEAFADKWQKASFVQDGEDRPFIFTYDPSFIPPADLAGRIKATVRLAIDEGKAEVLSSPSVLVLNNRNAKIQVVQDVPIVTTLITEKTTNLKVDYKTVGIILNIKPRISRDNDQVAMQILVEVSEAPPEDFVVVNEQNIAPLINRRVVETMARVQDNTPFIIGGLIRNEKAQTVDRMPWVSKIPVLGWLFKSQTDRRAKREVIIVLTPRIITPGGSQRPVLPKDSAQFDFLDNRLFRNSYRLKAEDVFDLRFLENNRLIRRAFAQARDYARENPRGARRWPVASFANGVIPGEDAMVVRMLYEIVKKLGLHEDVLSDHVLFFDQDETKPAGFGVRFLQPTLLKESPDGTLEGYFRRAYPKHVLFLRYATDTRTDVTRALEAPVATVEWYMAANRDTVEQRLLELNDLAEQGGHQEYALAIDEPGDLERLQAAVALREMISVNDASNVLLLRNFRVGRKVVVPQLQHDSRDRMFLIGRDVAEYFYKSDFYYSALQRRLEVGYQRLQEIIGPLDEQAED